MVHVPGAIVMKWKARGWSLKSCKVRVNEACISARNPHDTPALGLAANERWSTTEHWVGNEFLALTREQRLRSVEFFWASGATAITQENHGDKVKIYVVRINIMKHTEDVCRSSQLIKSRINHKYWTSESSDVPVRTGRRIGPENVGSKPAGHNDESSLGISSTALKN